MTLKQDMDLKKKKKSVEKKLMKGQRSSNDDLPLDVVEKLKNS